MGGGRGRERGQRVKSNKINQKIVEIVNVHFTRASLQLLFQVFISKHITIVNLQLPQWSGSWLLQEVNICRFSVFVLLILTFKMADEGDNSR